MVRELYRIPHLQVGELGHVDKPGGHGVAPYREYSARTACGEEKPDTLVTRRRELVRCPDCLAAVADADDSTGEEG